MISLMAFTSKSIDEAHPSYVGEREEQFPARTSASTKSFSRGDHRWSLEGDGSIPLRGKLPPPQRNLWKVFFPQILLCSLLEHKNLWKVFFSTNSDEPSITTQKFVESMFPTNFVVLPIRAQKFVESVFSTNSVEPSIRAQQFVESMFSTKTYALIEVWFIVEQCYYWVLYFVE